MKSARFSAGATGRFPGSPPFAQARDRRNQHMRGDRTDGQRRKTRRDRFQRCDWWSNRTGTAVWDRILADLAPFCGTIAPRLSPQMQRTTSWVPATSADLFLLVDTSSIPTRSCGSFSRTSNVSVGRNIRHKFRFGWRLRRHVTGAAGGTGRRSTLSVSSAACSFAVPQSFPPSPRFSTNVHFDSMSVVGDLAGWDENRQTH